MPKRLIVACDGTWVDSDNGFIRDSWLPWNNSGHLATPSNVTRIVRALEPSSEDKKMSQVVYYQAGLGSRNDWYSFIFGGYLGDGLAENIREAYAFLCNNYEEGDEIHLIGFSRGAFTARSIGGLIDAIGLLTRKGLGSFYLIFKDWENQNNPNYKPKYHTAHLEENRPLFHERGGAYMGLLINRQLTRPVVHVKSIAVWDTVGSLGVPQLTLFGFIKLFTKAREEYSFVNTQVPGNLGYAYQALALDDMRKPFAPSVWEQPKPGAITDLEVLRQCWFPGVHSSVGGGYDDTSISDITLAWMITQLSNHLNFDKEYLKNQQQQNAEWYKSHNPPLPVRSWALGQIARSDLGLLNTLAGRVARTPGEYHATDPATGKPTDRRLKDTCEFMHPSVRYRMQNGGSAVSENVKDPQKGSYLPKALEGWEFKAPGQPWREDKALSVIDGVEKWDGYGKWVVKRKDGSATFIVEEPIEDGTGEMTLVKAWPGVAGKLPTGGLIELGRQ